MRSRGIPSPFAFAAIACAGFLAVSTGGIGAPAAPSPGLQITTDFPGGSAVVAELDDASQTIHIHPALHFERGWPCWWYVIPIMDVDNVAMGAGGKDAVPRDHNIKTDEERGRMSSVWVLHHSGPHAVATTLETAWNTPHSTQEGYQTVGRQLGRALAAYLAMDPSRSAPEQPRTGAAAFHGWTGRSHGWTGTCA